jgi:hypothetical protein
MPESTRAWALRLADLLGARPEDATEEDLSRLIAGGVREDSDLDFKQERYGNSDPARRDLAGDIAAMANTRGGLIIIGIRDENDVAVELTPVQLEDGEEARIRQIAASNIAPHLTFDVRVLHNDADESLGYYLLIVQPSSLSPHAVRQDRNLRFPRRDGTTTRWLTEPEVADAYRDRFRLAGDQAGRVEQLVDEGLGAMDLGGAAFIAVALVPTGLGSMTIDLARVRSVEQWARDFGSPILFTGFFPDGTSPTAGVGSHRITLTTLFERDSRPHWQYAELFDDGAGFASKRLMDPRRDDGGDERSDILVMNTALLSGIGQCLHVLGDHAVRRCGAWGDALVAARLVGERMQLADAQRIGSFETYEPIAGGRLLDGARSRHTVVVEAAASVGQALSAPVRLIATDIFHAFGSPEVRQIAGDGSLRTRYWGGNGELSAWAQQHGIEVSGETVAGE